MKISDQLAFTIFCSGVILVICMPISIVSYFKKDESCISTDCVVYMNSDNNCFITHGHIHNASYSDDCSIKDGDVCRGIPPTQISCFIDPDFPNSCPRMTCEHGKEYMVIFVLTVPIVCISAMVLIYSCFNIIYSWRRRSKEYTNI